MSSTPAGPPRAEPLSEPLGVDLVRRGLSAELGHDPRSLPAALRGRDGLVHGLGELLVDDPFWQYPAWGLAREGAGHLRVWATATAAPGYLAVVTETGGIISVTESAGRIWAGLARRYGPCLVLLEHHPAPESGEGMETLVLVRIGADGSPHWSRVWPTPEENPRHAGLERWMAADGHQIVGRPASWFDWSDDTNR